MHSLQLQSELQVITGMVQAAIMDMIVEIPAVDIHVDHLMVDKTVRIRVGIWMETIVKHHQDLSAYL